MLQTIHDKLKGIFAVTILVALGIVFVFWGVNFSTDIGGFSKAKGIEVNGREVAVEEVRRDYQEQMSRFEAAMGESGVPEEMRKSIQQRVLDQAVQMELVRQRTRELDFEATDTEVLEAIQSIPAFQVEGRFSKDAYQAALRNINLTPDRFEAEQREFVLARQLDRGIEGSAFVLPSELQRQVALRSETRTLGWVTVPAREFESAAVIDDTAIRKYYEANSPRYMTEEQATVDYVELDIDAFAAQASVTEETLRQYYEENKARFTQPGRRRARHILIEAGDDDKAAEEKARRAYERAKAGEDFPALARELSDDTGSKESGGDLGESERSDFVGPFGDAVWGMQPGEIRGPVKTDFGWHVIKLESVTPEVTQGFEEVRAELESEYRHSQVEKAFGDAQEELDTRAFEASGDIAAVAGQMKLPLKRIERYTRGGSAELGATPKVTEAVFSPDVLAGRELRTVELAPGKVIALAVKAHEPAKAKPLEDVRGEIIESARLEAAARLAAARAAEVVAELGKGAAWSAAVVKWKGEAATQDPKPMGRKDAAAPAEVLEAAFRAPAPGSGPRYGVATLANGDTAIWTVTSARKGNLSALASDARQAAQEDARNRAAMSDATVYVTSMRANADVDVNPKLFE